MRKEIKSYIVAILLPLAVGGLSALLTRGSMDIYETINTPSFVPPGIVFPIVWTILYILMGISSGIIYNSKSNDKDNALFIYIIQLMVNFVWSIIFFNLRAFLIAFLLIIVLWVLIALMISRFYKIDKTAAYLQIPYLLWVTFAGILSFAIYLLNR
ncbi:MAG: tryptophan-rich sensory protein [Clostridia bacterium]|nr:tryptophan-rich sensory protein [Clostridia bacterium]